MTKTSNLREKTIHVLLVIWLLIGPVLEALSLISVLILIGVNIGVGRYWDAAFTGCLFWYQLMYISLRFRYEKLKKLSRTVLEAAEKLAEEGHEFEGLSEKLDEF